MQSHSHGLPQLYRWVGSGGTSNIPSTGNAVYTSGLSTDSVGGGNAQNLQPYQVTSFVIKI